MRFTPNTTNAKLRCMLLNIQGVSRFHPARNRYCFRVFIILLALLLLFSVAIRNGTPASRYGTILLVCLLCISSTFSSTPLRLALQSRDIVTPHNHLKEHFGLQSPPAAASRLQSSLIYTAFCFLLSVGFFFFFLPRLPNARWVGFPALFLALRLLQCRYYYLLCWSVFLPAIQQQKPKEQTWWCCKGSWFSKAHFSLSVPTLLLPTLPRQF